MLVSGVYTPLHTLISGLLKRQQIGIHVETNVFTSSKVCVYMRRRTCSHVATYVCIMHYISTWSCKEFILLFPHIVTFLFWKESKLEKENIAAKIELLDNLSGKIVIPGTTLDCIAFHDDHSWRYFYNL